MSLSVTTALAVSFAAGWWVANDRRDAALRGEPCSIRRWSAEDQGFSNLSVDVRECLKLGTQKTYVGVWGDYALGASFVPDDRKELPSDPIDLSVDGLSRARIQWLAKVDGPPEWFSSKRYRVKIRGRLGDRGHLVFDGARYIIVVDQVLEATALPAETR